MRNLIFITLLCCSCAKEFKEKNICQPIKPENNGLIRAEYFYGDGSGAITDLVASPFGTIYYTMFLSENIQQASEYFQIIIGGQVGQIDSSKIRAEGAFRYEFGEFTTEGYKKNSLYLPDFFVPQEIIPIVEGTRKGDVIIYGRFLNFIASPYNFDGHIFIYNYDTNELEDILQTPNNSVSACYKGFSGTAHEIIYAANTDQQLVLLKLSDTGVSSEVTPIGDVNFFVADMKYKKKEGVDFIFASSGYYNLTDGYGYSNLFKIQLENGTLDKVYPLALAAGNQSTGNLRVNDEYAFWAATAWNESVKTGGNYSSTYRYINSVLKKAPISSIDGYNIVESCATDNSDIFCDSDFKFHVDEKKNANFKLNWAQTSGDVIIDNTHFWGIGTTSNKIYTYEKDDEIVIKNISIANIRASSLAVGDCKSFTFGEKDKFCAFNCATIVGDNMYVGGTATSGKAWLIKFAVADLK